MLIEIENEKTSWSAPGGKGRVNGAAAEKFIFVEGHFGRGAYELDMSEA